MNSRFISLTLPFIVYNFIFFVSLFIINEGIYTSELQKETFDNSSQWVFLFYFLLSLSIFYIFYRISNLSSFSINLDVKEQNFIIVFISLMAAFYSVPILIHGPAMLNGLNRYQFLLLKYVDFFNIKAWISLTCYFLGILYFYRKRASIILLICIVLLTLLYGEKASGPILMFTFFISGLLMKMNVPIKVFSKITLLAMLVAMFLVFIYFIQLVLLDLETERIINAFYIRLGRQSQIFWELYNRFPFADYNVDKSSLFGNIFHSGDTISSMHYMMKIVMPIDEYIKHGGSLAGGYPSVLLLITNNLVEFFLLSSLLSILYISVVFFFFVSLFRFKYSMYFAPIFFFAFTVHLKVFQTGNLSLFLNEKYIVVLFCSILSFILIQIKQYRKRM